MKLKLMEVSSTDTDAVEVKFQLAGDNMSSEEIFKFLYKQIAEDGEIKLKAKNDMYTFTKSLTSSSETTEFISRIKNILEELITEDEKRKVTPRCQVERSLVHWLVDKVLKGDMKLM